MNNKEPNTIVFHAKIAYNVLVRSCHIFFQVLDNTDSTIALIYAKEILGWVVTSNSIHQVSLTKKEVVLIINI